MNSRVTILDQLPAPRRHQLKVRSLDELLAAIGDHRLAGQSIVFTNGCFDLLHVGHLRLLEEAAALGDVLIVAVNSDASVKRLKGPARPVVGEAQRAAMLAALECVGGRKKGRKKGPE